MDVFYPTKYRAEETLQLGYRYNPSTAFWLNPFFPLIIPILKHDTWGKNFRICRIIQNVCLLAMKISVSIVAKTKITLLWNEIKIRISILEREIVNK